MHWIIQTDLFQEAGWRALVDTLERFNIPHSIHKVIPFVGEILPDANPDGPVICIGAYSLRHLAKKKGWTPGVFDLEPFDFEIQKVHWGKHMLNYDAKVSRFEDAVFPFYSVCSAHIETDPNCNTCKIGSYADEMFIRPVLDSKSFAGSLFTAEDFYDWKRKIVVLEHDYGNTVDKDTVIQMCPLKTIYAEYRYWIVKGEIVTKSLYKRGDKVMYSSDVDPRFDDYVKDRIAEWQPLDAFVIDVCNTSQGIKIVEINTLNSSGFYAGDMQKLVIALEDAFGV